MLAGMSSPAPLVWVDLEMTGLDPETCAIVEIAILVTDGDLRIVAEGPNMVIHQPESVLATMNDFVRELHTRSGLLTRIRESKVTLEQARAETLTFVQSHCDKGVSPLCGNSVWKDREFLQRYMPEVVAHLHYRIIDVSTIKELARRWYAGKVAAPPKAERHRAHDDIRESLVELAYYRQHLFVPLASVPPSPASSSDV
jgi:oligoribonuclease